MIYSTTLCLLHRAHMPPASSAPNSYRVEEIAYPSRTIAFQAAAMITSIIETLQAHNEIGYTPAFMYVQKRMLLSDLVCETDQLSATVSIACSRP